MSSKEVQCHYCKKTIEKGIKNCPHCNTVNPSVRVKEVLVWTIGMVIVMYVVSLFIT